METFDNPIDGDGGHIRRWASIRYHLGDFGVYMQRVGWLWRNKAYNFAYHVLGREATSKFNWKGNPKTEGGPNPVNHGYLLMWNESAWGFVRLQTVATDPQSAILFARLCWMETETRS